jgi:hypothetical protein
MTRSANRPAHTGDKHSHLYLLARIRQPDPSRSLFVKWVIRAELESEIGRSRSPGTVREAAGTAFRATFALLLLETVHQQAVGAIVVMEDLPQVLPGRQAPVAWLPCAAYSRPVRSPAWSDIPAAAAPSTDSGSRCGGFGARAFGRLPATRDLCTWRLPSAVPSPAVCGRDP